MEYRKSLFGINIAVFLFGMAGLFAKWIHIPAIGITFGRVFFSSMTLLLFSFITKKDIKVKNRKHFVFMIFAGIILAIHWWSFLYSIQISTVAIGTITFSSFPLFVTLLEPLIFHEKLYLKDIFFCLLILLGVLITIPSFSFENLAFQGIIVGMISALSYAVLTLINRYFSNIYTSTTISLYEQTSAAIVLIPTLFLIKVEPTVLDLSLLLCLGIITTAFAHTLFISSLKHIPAHIAGIISSMESVYGIILAAILFCEIPSIREMIGAIVIIGTVILAQLKGEKL